MPCFYQRHCRLVLNDKVYFVQPCQLTALLMLDLTILIAWFQFGRILDAWKVVPEIQEIELKQ